MKNTKKIITSFILFLFVIMFSIYSCATTTTTTTTFELVTDTTCTIEIDDWAEFTKSVADFSSTERSISITLNITNTKVSESTTTPTEVFLVIDNSSSMRSNSVGDYTREEVVIASANKLVEKLFAANNQIEIGVVAFSSGETEGTINDASLLLELSDSQTDVESAVSAVADTNAGVRTNIEAGVTLASQYFSSDEDTNRYIILLTDGVPNNDLSGNYSTYSGDVATNTKAALQSIEASGISIIGAMIGLDSDTIETSTGMTYQALAEEIFGTEDNPTISSYYYISSTEDEIEQTIVEEIYSDIIVETDNTLYNIVIKDYFPQEIVDNFDFEYTVSPNIGEISAEIDTDDNSITWTISELAEGETATLTYTLTLIDNYSEDIIDVILDTNEEVDITAEDEEGNTYEETSEDTPQVRVTVTTVTEEDEEDDTVANTIIPQTGQNDTSLAFIIIISIVAISFIARFIYLKRNME